LRCHARRADHSDQSRTAQYALAPAVKTPELARFRCASIRVKLYSQNLHHLGAKSTNSLVSLALALLATSFSINFSTVLLKTLSRAAEISPRVCFLVDSKGQ